MASNTEKQLLQLCTDGNLPSLKDFITKQRLNTKGVKDSSGLTLLHFACQHGHLDVAQYLIKDQHCSPETTTPNGRTSLHIACKSGHFHIAKYLITDHKCNPHCTDNDGYTPLHAASESGNIETVKYLITEQGCDPQVSDSIGNTPLHYASEGGHLHTVQELITSFNCDPQKPNKRESIPLHYACKGGQTAVARYLIEEHQCNPNYTNMFGNTSLHVACLSSCLPLVKYLIDKHACNPQTVNNKGLTPLHFACLKGHLDITKYLISDCNCNPQCSDKNGFTPLHSACQNGRLEVAKYLITEHKCSPEHGNVNGYTPLHSSASNGHLAVVKYLISELGCNPQIITNNGLTSLHYACLKGRLDITEYLITDCNCDPQCSDKVGSTSLHCACWNGHLEVAKYLITEHKCSPEHGNVNGYTPLHSAAAKGHLTIVKYLISELGCNPQITDNNGLTPLHETCSSGHLHVAQYLIREQNCACEPKATINDEMLPAVAKKKECFPLMVKAYETFLFVKYMHGGTTTEITNKAIEGITPLHFACMKGHLDMVKYLIDVYKCNLNYATSNGLTAIDLAQLCGHKEVVSYLRDEHQCSSSWSQVLSSLMLQAWQNPFEFNFCLAYSDKMCISPLQQACIIGDLEAVKFCIIKSDHNPSSAGLLGLTPLHTACMMGHLEIAKYLVFECKCDPNCAVVENTPQTLSTTSHYQNTFITPLTVATAWGQLNIIEWLVSELKCNPECNENSFPLDILACMFGQLEVLRYLLHKSDSQVLPHLLFAACCFGDLKIAKYLIDVYKCIPHSRSDDGAISLHFACINMQHLSKNKHQPSEEIPTSNLSIKGILLHIWHAIIFPVTMVTQLLTNFVPEFPNPAKQMKNYDILSDAMWANRKSRSDEQTTTPNLDVVKYLITEHKCNPQCRDKEGQTPLHYACASGQLEIVQYLHSEKLSDLVHTAHSGDTPLHFACKYDQVEVVQFLLSTGECNPMIKNAEELSPLEIATSPEIRKLLDHFCKGKYPLELVVKVFVLGDPMAGKSSLVQAIQNDPGFFSSLTPKKVQGVRKQTAGISLLRCSSSDFGDVMIYDFAGQREFHTNHAAFLQNYSTLMTGIFIIVTNIAQCEDNICQSLQYWISFLRDCCTHNKMKPHVIFVGSHADQLDKGDIDQAFTTIEQGFSVNNIFKTEAVICLDCTQSSSSDMNLLHYHLTESCNFIRQRTEEIDQCCYVLHKYVYKEYINKSVSGCRLKSISEDLEGNLYLLPSNSNELLPLFQTLHDKGQVLLLKNDQDIGDSWIIINIAAMLETVVGSIFAPRDFPQHIAPGGTGIVPKSRIGEAFCDINIDMVIGFLEHFEFCHRVGLDWIDGSLSNQTISDDEYYLFPALVTSEIMPKVSQENHKISYYCGWLMYSAAEDQFFTTRFLHVLLLRLAFLFAPPQDETMRSSRKIKATALSRKCNMWKNGISWPDTNGVKAFFEVKSLKIATLRMMCIEGRETHCVRLRTKLIRAILKAKNEFCLHIHVEECIVEVAAGSLHAVLECPSHSIKYLSTTIANRDSKDDPDLILTHPDGSSGKQISELLYFEPYAVLTPDLITQLFAKENAKKQVSSSFITRLANCMYPFSDSLRRVFDLDPSVLSARLKHDHLDSIDKLSRQQLKCKHILEAWMEQLGPAATYRNLRQELNEYSIFCGRNPLDLSDESDEISEEESATDSDEKCLSDEYQPTLIECVRFRGRERRFNIPQEIGVKYRDFGLFLLEDHNGARIRSIAHKYNNDADQINTEVLEEWVAGKGRHPITWKTLTQVLQDIELSTLAGEIEAVKCHTDIPTESSEHPVQKTLRGIPTEGSEQKSTGHSTPANVAENDKQCKTSELQVDIDLLVADLLTRYYENQSRSASHEVSKVSSKDLTAELSKESDQRICGDMAACGVEEDRYYEAIQHIVHIASALPSRCSEVLEAFEQDIELPVQGGRREITSEITTGSEQRDIPASSIQHNLQQIVDVAADLLSKSFELEAINLEREEDQRSSEGFEDRVDAAAYLLNEAGLISCKASNHETQRSSGPHGASEDPPFQRGLKHTTTESFKPRGVPASSIEDVWYDEALQQIADVAADLLHECFELLDRTNQTQRENQGNSVPHGEQGENGNIPERDVKDAKCCEALQHIADIAADILYRCFVLLDLQTLHQEKEELKRNSASSPQDWRQTMEHYSSTR